MGFDFNKVVNRDYGKIEVIEQVHIALDLIKLDFKPTNSVAVYIQQHGLSSLFSHPMELLKGNPVKKDIDRNQGSSLPKIDVAEVDRIIKGITKYLKKNKKVNIPNWKKSLEDIISDTEVWLITEEDIKNGTTVIVENKFSKKDETTGKRQTKSLKFADLFSPSPWEISKELIQDIKEQEDKVKSLISGCSLENTDTRHQTLPECSEELEGKRKELWGKEFYYRSNDWLGCYCPETGTIVLRIERIIKESKALSPFGVYSGGVLFQKVLLHEFIHAALDLNPRNAEGEILGNKEEWKNVICNDTLGSVIEFNEETIDNAMVLKVYEKADKEMYNSIYNVISIQPYYYRNAIVMKEAKELNKSLEHNLASLIKYKITGKSEPLKQSKRKEELKPTLAEGELMLRFQGIGVFVYGIYAMIIKKRRFKLSEILETNSVFKNKNKHLWLIGEEKYAEEQKKRKDKKIQHYALPLLTADGEKVYVSSQWKDKNSNFLDKLIQKYLEPEIG